MLSQSKPPAPEKNVDKGKDKMLMDLISLDQLEKSLNEYLTCDTDCQSLHSPLITQLFFTRCELRSCTRIF